MNDAEHQIPRKHEFAAFLFLTVILAPMVTIALVGGYGFPIWIFQIMAGPPGV